MKSFCKIVLLAILGIGYVVGGSCASGKSRPDRPVITSLLVDTLSTIVSEYPGEIGIGLIINNIDTVVFNNRNIYPMMSVFKLHQALAVCDESDREGLSLDSVVTISRKELDSKTWSPMLKEYEEDTIKLSVKDLLRYTLTVSDNNASNWMFRHIVGVDETDNYVTSLIPRSMFNIEYTEEEMSADHKKAYSNTTSPLGAAILINRLYNERLLSAEKQDFIISMLEECATGVDRIVAPLLDKEDVKIGHKTGSGYINERGELAAHNDVAYIRLPGGTSYALAVFVKDFRGDEKQASEAIARISEIVYSRLSQ